MYWASLWAIFFQTHLVTLRYHPVTCYGPSLKNAEKHVCELIGNKLGNHTEFYIRNFLHTLAPTYYACHYFFGFFDILAVDNLDVDIKHST
jgi:hypothetical protein